MADTPFSFHCMICFEEFHPDDRYPVVLPCGHTYVCNACANRLDKCMECRTPLYTIIPNKNGPSNNYNSSPSGARPTWASARSGGRISDATPQAPPPIKKRVVLPKNVVLLSLIEATELASEDARKKYSESPAIPYRKVVDCDGAAPVPGLHSMGSMLDAAEDEEEERIKMSTSLAVGVAGTYAVAAKNGLEIFPSRPNSHHAVCSDLRDQDVDDLVKFYNAEQTEDVVGTPNSRRSRDHLRLCFGDRVQIVSVDGGWAKLARGYGFVRADKNQLVKVGGSVDRACKLEAILCSLSTKRKDLRFEQTRIDNQFIRYMNDLQHSLQNDEDLTVILADTFAPLPEAKEAAYIESEEKKSPSAEERNDHSYPVKPEPPQTPERPSTPTRTNRFACFAGNVFGGDDSEQESTNAIRNTYSINETGSANSALNLFPAASHPSPSAMRAGAQAWRERHGRFREGTSTDEQINFRTGMSGHMALLSSHANSHKYLEPTFRGNGTVNRGGGNRMSSHAGLGMAMPSLHGILNSFTLPVIGTPPRRPEDQGIRHTGSM